MTTQESEKYASISLEEELMIPDAIAIYSSVTNTEPMTHHAALVFLGYKGGYITLKKLYELLKHKKEAPAFAQFYGIETL